mmetsp:Transcript_43451/g.102610  ORF Transcript_43451/g.102610 Transcript_43451/m.102610 type:complete len:251 (+) Transcript_43451:456-1208(+)
MRRAGWRNYKQSPAPQLNCAHAVHGPEGRGLVVMAWNWHCNCDGVPIRWNLPHNVRSAQGKAQHGVQQGRHASCCRRSSTSCVGGADEPAGSDQNSRHGRAQYQAKQLAASHACCFTAGWNHGLVAGSSPHSLPRRAVLGDVLALGRSNAHEGSRIPPKEPGYVGDIGDREGARHRPVLPPDNRDQPDGWRSGGESGISDHSPIRCDQDACSGQRAATTAHHHGPPRDDWQGGLGRSLGRRGSSCAQGCP